MDCHCDAVLKKKKTTYLKRAFVRPPAAQQHLSPSPHPLPTEALHFCSPPLRSLGSYYVLIYVSRYRWKSCQHPLRHPAQIYSLQLCPLTWGMSGGAPFFFLGLHCCDFLKYLSKYLYSSSSVSVDIIMIGSRLLFTLFPYKTHSFVCICVCLLLMLFHNNRQNAQSKIETSWNNVLLYIKWSNSDSWTLFRPTSRTDSKHLLVF